MYCSVSGTGTWGWHTIRPTRCIFVCILVYIVKYFAGVPEIYRSIARNTLQYIMYQQSEYSAVGDIVRYGMIQLQYCCNIYSHSIYVVFESQYILQGKRTHSAGKTCPLPPGVPRPKESCARYDLITNFARPRQGSLPSRPPIISRPRSL